MTATTGRPAVAAAVPARVRRPRQRSRSVNSSTPWGLVGRYTLLVLVLVVTVGPMLWELSTSLKSITEDVYTATPHFLPQHPTLGNYAKVNETIPVWRFAGNSLIVAVLDVGGNVVGASIAGFALAKLNFRGRRLVLGVFLSTLVLPAEVTIVSQFQTVTDLGLGNTLLGVALPNMISAINVLLMRNAFQSIPPELDDAAVLDGANTWQRFRYIGLPSVTGILSVVCILSFIAAWDDFLWPLLVLQNPNNLTLTVGLAYLQNAFSVDPRTLAAGAMIALLPILLLFLLLQRFFFRGVGEGAVKG